MGNLLNYESDTQTANTAPMKYPSSQRSFENPGLPNYGGKLTNDGQSTTDISYENAVIPLDNRGQISLSRELNAQNFLRPTSNLSPRLGPYLTLGENPSQSAPSMDQMLKVRQLEMKLLDMKGLVDRKLLQFQEEVPQQIKREIQAIEIKEQQLVKDISMKFQSI